MSSTDTPVKRSRELVDQLKRSQIYRDYEQAFRDTTGLPLNLRPIEAFDLPHHDDPNENPFCALMAQSNHTCAACLQLQRKVEEQAQMEPKTLKCFAGLCDSAVPIRVGENLVAFLQTGQILLHKPDEEQFAKTTRQILKWGTDVDLKKLEEAYFQTRVVTKRQYESIVRLLTIFAQHLATLSNQLAVREENAESPTISRARAFISENHSDDLSLDEVARAVNMSAFYFCKMFKKATGMTFTDYLARVRVEKVKNLLLNPHKRISEAAFEVGFQSLSQFNRVFRKIAGEAPTGYRDRIHKPA
ncbi:helix-turn-helix domain-containing protein [Opitutaceae bacterium TAV4]|uniref:PocR ligand-binding domain-containing protein n=1 Tax=Geminisphaera colitermitum TaxID=1148786 RepID=UPI000158D377|nr:PocR ligand-binding domain-containing protein [Geminisphaera colitermitum]RRJ96366.1 helix-turn-helix domain-containing protein [Opitutaceae bacterium TAV4]RRK00506.1 helix-turn-helix domain-containing protein [Opitutaceae bacterium TAV3]